MWLRRLLGAAFELADLSADTPAAVDWDDLPERCALQLHWPPDSELLERLDAASFRTVALARHPLDVLISILQFAQHEPRTARWLNGEGGTELALLDAEPCSAAFLDYATGPRAAALLDVSVAWWREPRLDARVHYEGLVADPPLVLTGVAAALGGAAPGEISRSTDCVTFRALQAETQNGHFWRGRPGLWRSLLTTELVDAIAAAQPDAFAVLGYDADADPELSVELAEANWRELTGDRRTVRRLDARASAEDVVAHLSAVQSPAEFVDHAYRLVLRREPDPGGRSRTIERLAAGLVSPATVIRELSASAEGRRVRAYDDGVAFAAWARSAGERPRALSAPAGVDESAIALPWALSRYRGEAEVLDVGHAFARPAQLAAMIALGSRRLIGLDLVETHVDGYENVVGDARTLPFPSRSFDVAFCLGTLHHVGRDNRAFGLEPEADPDGELRALAELRRVLRRDGRAFVTVPCGAEQDLAMFVQHTPERWLQLFAEAGFVVFEEERYALDVDGWGSAEAVDDVRYAERGATASALLCVELQLGRRRESVRRYMRARGIEPPRASRPTGT